MYLHRFPCVYLRLSYIFLYACSGHHAQNKAKKFVRIQRIGFRLVFPKTVSKISLETVTP